MENFFTENEDIQLLFKNSDLTELIDLKEGDYSDSEKFDYAFTDARDAKEGYGEILTLIGEIAAQIISPLAPDIDEEGCHFDEGAVTYAEGTQKSLEVLRKSNLMGFTLPRKY